MIRKMIFKTQDVTITEEQKKQIQYDIFITNLRRGRVYGLGLVLIEILIIIIFDLPKIKNVSIQDTWIYNSYLLLHSLIALVAVLGFLMVTYLLKIKSKELFLRYKLIPHIFCTLILILTAGITGVDQVTTGQITAYIPNILIVGTLVFMEYPSNIIVFTIPHLIFISVLLFFQNDPVLLTSSLFNGSIFYLSVLIVSTFVYENHKSHLIKNIILAETNQKLNHLADHDLLTDLPNRRYFEEYFNQKLASARGQNQEATLIIIDIDHFKIINDRYGHRVGDIILRELSKLLAKNMRENDLVCRWGGEEFLILLTHFSIDEAVITANRIRELIADNVIIINEQEIKITVSIGMIQLTIVANLSFDEAFVLADQALYCAKEHGRNRVEVAGDYSKDDHN